MATSRTPIEVALLDPSLREHGFAPSPMEGLPGVYELRAFGFIRKDAGGHPDLRSGIVPLNQRSIILGTGVVLCPGQDAYISVGFSMRILDPGMVARIVPHPDAATMGIGIVNGVGIVGGDYDGPVLIHVRNTNPPYIETLGGSAYAELIYRLDATVGAVAIPFSMPIARLYLAPVHEAEWRVL